MKSRKNRSRSQRRSQLFEQLEDRRLLAVALGDFNGDGYQDMAIGSPLDDLAGTNDVGAVNVIYGSAKTDPPALHQFFHQQAGLVSDSIADVAEEGDRFGYALVAGNFNGDVSASGHPIDDLAIGVPGQDVHGIVNAGSVQVVYGSSTGLVSWGNQLLTQDTPGMPGEAQEFDRFGSVLSAGDYNGDGADDLAIGVPSENVNGKQDGGQIHIVYGTVGSGLGQAANDVFDQSDIGPVSEGVMGKGAVQHYDQFGAALVSADFNNDGADDLAIGVPGEDHQDNFLDAPDGGAVQLLWGQDAIGLTPAWSNYYSPYLNPLVSPAEAFDNFGATLAAGDFDGDGKPDLAVGIVNEDGGAGQEDMGAVNILYSDAKNDFGFDLARTQMFHPNQESLGADGTTLDFFGAALAAGDFNGDGLDDLAIGIPGREIEEYFDMGNAGVVQVLFSGTGGLTAAGNQIYHQNIVGVEDDAEAFDYFGARLAAGDLDGDGEADLVVSVPGEDYAGAVHVFPGKEGKNFLDLTLDDLWWQDATGVADEAGSGDSFGGMVPEWISDSLLVVPAESWGNTFFLHSKADAPRRLYLDFNGGWSPHHATNTKSKDIETPVFSIDTTSGWNRTELAIIEHAWAAVAEDFAPFDIDVTTEPPYDDPNFDGEIYRVLIGGDGTERNVNEDFSGWSPDTGHFFDNDARKDVFVFSDKFSLGGNTAKSLADTISHEAGHGLGLGHKNEIDDNDEILDIDGIDGIELDSGPDDYSPGGDGWSPIMGTGGERTIWTEHHEWISWDDELATNRWLNGDNSVTHLKNSFGLVPDVHPGPVGETDLGTLDHRLVAHGKISEEIDVDRFRFDLQSPGWVTMQVWNSDVSPNLDSTLSLMLEDSVLTDAPDDSTDASRIDYLEAGSHVLEIGSNGAHPGDIGQYTLRISQPYRDLLVQGTDGDDDVVVRMHNSDEKQLAIEVNATTHYYQLAYLRSIRIVTGSGVDDIEIRDLPEHIDLVVDAGAHGDNIQVGDGDFATIAGNIVVIGGGGTDGLVIDDHASAGVNYELSGNEIRTPAYPADKTFRHEAIEHLSLDANAQGNQIGVSNLNGPLLLTVEANGGHDHIRIRDTADNVAAEVLGGPDSDTLTVGSINGIDGNVGSVRGPVTFDGGTGKFNKMVFDDSNSPVGRNYEFNSSTVFANHGFGSVIHYEDVTDILLRAGGHNDVANVESLLSGTDIELFGNKGTDVFYVAGISHDVDAVLGQVTVHGGAGYAPGVDMPDGSEGDQLYIYDHADPNGDQYDVGLPANPLAARVAKSTPLPGGNLLSLFQIDYDQIELTHLRAGKGNNTINVAGAPAYNRLAVFGSDGSDTVVIESVPEFAPMQVFGEAGGDTIKVLPTYKAMHLLASRIDIDGGAGSGYDKLEIDDTLSGSTSPYALTGAEFAREDASIVGYSGMELLALGLSQEDNEMTIKSTAAWTPVYVSSQNGDDDLTVLSASSAIEFSGGPHEDSIRWEGTTGEDEFQVSGSTIELGSGMVTTLADVELREIHGGGETDALVLLGQEGVDEHIHVRPKHVAFAGQVEITGAVPLRYESVEEMDVVGNEPDTDTLQVDGQNNLDWLYDQFRDHFQVHLAALGTSDDPVLVLRKNPQSELLRLRNFTGLDSTTLNGLGESDVFQVVVDPLADSPSRTIRIDSGGTDNTLWGDSIMLGYASPKPAKGNLAPSPLTWDHDAATDSGQISLEYKHHLYDLFYENFSEDDLYFYKL